MVDCDAPEQGVKCGSGTWLGGYNRGMSVVAMILPLDVNPVGPSSIVAAVAMLFLAGLTSRLIPLSANGRRRWTIAAPVFVLGIFVLAFVFWPAMPFDTDDEAAGIILLVAGFFFALQNFRYGSACCRANAAMFGLAYGAAIVFLAITWVWGDSQVALDLSGLFVFVWIVAIAMFLTGRRAKWRIRDRKANQPVDAAFQFTLRGLLVGVIAVSIILGLCRARVEALKRDRLLAHDSALKRELLNPNDVLFLKLFPYDRALGNMGHRIVERLQGSSGEGRALIASLQAAGLDVAELDAFEAVIFWLVAKPLSESSNQQLGAKAGQSPQPDWPARLARSHVSLDSFALVDRDDDGWPEYVFESWGPEYPEKMFRLEGGRIEAWDTTPSQATGIRKGYALDEEGELESFVVDDHTP